MDVMKALKMAERAGAEEAEVFASDNIITTIRIASSRVVETKVVREAGVGLRAAIGQRVGFTCASEFDQKLVEKAVSIARMRPPNPYFNGFAGPMKTDKVDGLYDKILAEISPERSTSLAELMLESALSYDRRIEDVSGALTVTVERCEIVNSNGLNVEDKATRIYAHLTSTTRGPNRAEGAAQGGATSLKEFDPVSIGKKASELAANSIKLKKVKQGKYNIILEPPSVAELFYHVFGYAVNGQDVYEQMSYFADKVNEIVASTKLSIYDWGNMPRGLFSKKVDDEGTPTRKTPLIEEGKLVGFVYDMQYACKAGTKSTGNGLRFGDSLGHCYCAEPEPYITNLVIQTGDFKRDELIEDTRKGLLIQRLWYTYPITPQIGDFSTTSRNAFLIEGGEVKSAVHQLRIHENLPKLLRAITGIADNATQIIPWGANACVNSPSIRFKGVRVS